ncbi:MAG: glycosyl hydrolase, partial [Saprospiraceae bacterium]
MKNIFLTLFAICSFYHISTSQSKVPNTFDNLKFRYIGVDGNRTIAVVGEPGNPMVSYVGAASGGIWKTEDGGLNWKPIFDDQDVAAIGSLALAPSNHNQLWSGTGESFVIRPAHPYGNGVYKSSDAGKSWKHMGLDLTARIGRIVVHPIDTNIVYVAALGNTHAPQQEKGVYKTIDGGKTWDRVFFINEYTGCNEIEIDQNNPNILFAAMWQVDAKNYGFQSGGEGSGVYRSTDAGKTWEPMNQRGIEFGKNHPIGKTSVCIAPSNSNIVYALIEDKEPRLYRTDNGGNTWVLVKKDHSMAQRAPYYTRVRVSTASADEVYTICVNILKSKDGGKSWVKPEGSPWAMGGDCHDMWFDPKNPDRQMVAHDGCMNMSSNGGKSWKNINLPVAQMYHVAVDSMIPYHVLGNRQDGYSYRGPSNSRTGSITLSDWKNVGGCESGFAQADPFDPNIIWSGCYDGGLDVTDLKTGIARDVRVWPETQYGWKPADVKYRWHWNFPMVLSRHKKNTVWVGSQFIHRTTDGGQSWQVISPDLTTADPKKMDNSGGISFDNLYTWDGATTLNMAESPVKDGLLWVGTNDGLLHFTIDGGNSWTNVTKNIPDLPDGGSVSCIEPSYFDASTCYVSFRFIYVGDSKSYIYKTTDNGKTWSKIIGDIPQNQSSTIFQIKEDPSLRGLLYAGTDNGVYFSANDGKNWTRLRSNLPPAPVYGIAVQKHFGDLVIGTYGRGLYILDDLTPIREWSEKIQQSSHHLFSVRPAYRFQKIQGTHAEGGSFSGSNPSYGA